MRRWPWWFISSRENTEWCKKWCLWTECYEFLHLTIPHITDLFALLTICCRRCICCSVFTVCGSSQSFASILFTLGLVAYAAGWGSKKVSEVRTKNCAIFYCTSTRFFLCPLSGSSQTKNYYLSISEILWCKFASVCVGRILPNWHCLLVSIRWDCVYRSCFITCYLGLPIH